MPDNDQGLKRIHWTECLPFTNIFRTFRLATHPTKLVLALAMIIATFAWGCILDRLWSAAGTSAICGEIHGYPAIADFDAWRDAYAKQKADALVVLLDQELNSKSIVKEVQADRVAALEKARGLLEERFKELIDPNEREKTEAEKLKDLPDDQRQAKLAEMVAASRKQYRDLKTQLASLGQRGIFAEWRQYESHYLNASFQAIRRLNFYRETDLRAISPRPADPGSIEAVLAGAEPFDALSVAANLCMMGRGVAWMLRAYPCFAVFFLLGTLAIWALFGGAICRIAALHAARDERIALGQALRFSRQKFLGFFTAPLIIAILLLLLAIGLAIGGAIAGLPALDMLGSLIFFLALFTGAIMALLAIGAVGGFSLMWPIIAVEGSDAFDAISRSYSYVLPKPWRSIFYAAVASLYGAFCLLFVRVFVWLALVCSHGALSYGIGWADRPNAGPGLNKLDIMWAEPTLGSLRPVTDSVSLSGTEHVTAFFIRLWVYVLVGLIYAFAISFYFSASTIIYYLLRRDVDATDLEDVYLEEYEESPEPFPSAAPAESGKPPQGEPDSSGDA